MTFESVTRAAGVSRSWLYTQPDIREEALRLRDLGRRAPGTSVPARHRSSDASLLRRLQATTARNWELAQDNQRLRHQLAHALGELRAAGIRLLPVAQSEDRAAAFHEDESAVIVDDRWRESTFIHAQTADGEW